MWESGNTIRYLDNWRSDKRGSAVFEFNVAFNI